MRKVILLTSNPYAINFLHSLRREFAVVKVMLSEDGKFLLDYFRGMFPATDFEIYDEKSLRRSISDDVNLVVFSFPHFIKRDIYQKAKLAVNIHFGRLPEGRGPDPLFWSLKNGTDTWHITVHKLSEKLDSGAVLAEREVTANADDNYGTAFARLSNHVYDLLAPVLRDFYSEKEQAPSAAYLSHPQEKDLKIDWQKMSAREIENLVKACNPKYGGALALLNGALIRILEATAISGKDSQKAGPGSVIESGMDSGLIVACKENEALSLNILSLNEGYFSGKKLAESGIQKGMMFT